MASRQPKPVPERATSLTRLPDIDFLDFEPEARDRGGVQGASTSPPAQNPDLRQQSSGIRLEERRTGHHRGRPVSETMVLPSAHQVVAQVIPDVSIALVLFLAAQFQTLLNPAEVSIWIALVFAPSLMMLALTDGRKNPLWRRAAMVNFITVGALLPICVVARYLVRTPYLDEAHGAVIPTVLGLLAALAVLLGLGFASAVLSREDPEYAGVLILPACLLIPVCLGEGRVSSLDRTLLAASIVFLVSAVATVVASLLTGALPALVAPAFFAGEFVLLSVLQDLPSIPRDAAPFISIAFLTLVFAAGAMTVIVPILSIWCARVRQGVQELDAHSRVR